MATRDYKAREKTRSNRGRRGGSGFFWFVTGAVFGGFGVGLAWMLQDRLPPRDVPTAQTAPQPPAKPRFDFHQILPEMEVVVSDEELSVAPPIEPTPPAKPPQQKEAAKPKQPEPKQAAKPKQPTPKEKPAAADGASYLVQIASFRQASDAERLKAKLALLGVQAKLQQVTVNGKAYHRVRAGPYKGKQKVNKTRSMLSSNGLDSIAIKVK